MVVASFLLKQIYFAIPNHLILAKYSPVLERQSSHCRGAAGAGRVKLKIIHPEPASTPGTAVLEPACSGPVTPYQHVGAVQVWRTNKDKTPSTSPSQEEVKRFQSQALAVSMAATVPDLHLEHVHQKLPKLHVPDQGR